MAATSSKKSTDINKLAALDEPTKAIASDDTSADVKAADVAAPATDESGVDAPVAIDPINISLSTRPAEHGLPAFPL